MEKTYDRRKAAEAQARYCEEHGYHDFTFEYGFCPFCGMNIYDHKPSRWGGTGISVEEAGSRLITGCPHCNHTYVD